MMAAGEDFSGRQSPFQRILDELDDEAPPFDSMSRLFGVDALWRAAPPSAGTDSPATEASGAYAESEGPHAAEKPAAPAESPRPPDLRKVFAEIRADLAMTRGVDDLRKLRWRCALALHPDRVPKADRAQAEKFMAEINAGIDRAIREKIPVPDKPV